jgi:hypothetical protein
VNEEYLVKFRSVRENVINEECLLILNAVLFMFLTEGENINNLTVYNICGTQSDDIVRLHLLKETRDHRITEGSM